MQKLIIEGPTKLEGSIKIAGSKNHVLPMMVAALLTTEEVVLHNVPQISDVATMAEILHGFGVRIEHSGSVLVLQAEQAKPAAVPQELTDRLRASVLVLGGMIGRFGEARMGYPGGDSIGARPLDTHFHGFEQLGIKVHSDEHEVSLEGHVKPATVVLDEFSVTATENMILASVVADGTTQIRMAAAEPHVTELCNFLNQMGARISGINSHVLTIEGVGSLHGAEGTITPDYLESGTFAIAAAASQGNVIIDDFVVEHHDALLTAFDRMGVNYKVLGPRKLQVEGKQKLQATTIRTDIYPGFPTDLQAPMAVLCTQAHGTSEIFETMYEGRLQYLFELQRMGARVNIRDSHVGLVEGPTTLQGTELVSFDIRAGATILIAAVIAQGKTIIDRIEHIDRGYEHFDGRLRALGAKIERTSD